MDSYGVDPSAEECLTALQERFSLSDESREKLAGLIVALMAEPDPPTTIRSAGAIAERHVADSVVTLEVEGLRQADRLADIGAGAGFPGLALAAVLPTASVDLVEASRRKCELIERLALASGIENARSVPARAESWAKGPGGEAYDVVTARAVASIAVLAEYAAPLLCEEGILVAWKGRRDRDEERAGSAAAEQLGLTVREVRRVDPFPDADEHHLYVLVKRGPTPPGFPRRPGRAAKRPLA